jgi:hypothetical protein
LVQERIAEELERQRKALEDPDCEIRPAQGSIKALRMVLSIPGILKEEYSKEEN